MQPSSDKPTTATSSRSFRRYGPLLAIVVVAAFVAGALVLSGGGDDGGGGDDDTGETASRGEGATVVQGRGGAGRRGRLARDL